MWLHVSSFSGDGVSGGVVHLEVDDVDAVYFGHVAKGVPIDSGPMDQTWGARELYVKDAAATPSASSITGAADRAARPPRPG